MSFNGLSDYREELYVSALRCLMIVRELAYGTNDQPILTMEKAAIFDFALKNPNIAKRIISALNPSKAEFAATADVLYPDNVDNGEAFNREHVLQVALLLKHKGFVEIVQIEGDYYLTPTTKTIESEIDIPGSWKRSLTAFRLIVRKPLSTIQKSVVREAQ